MAEPSDPGAAFADGGPPRLLAEPLGPDGLRAAYPLIRHAAPAVDLRSWVRFARGRARPAAAESGGGGAARSGIVAVRYAGQRFPCGLFCWRRERDLRRGLVVTAEHLVAVGVLDAGPVLDALLAELDALGVRLGCDAVRVAVPPGPLAPALRRRLPGLEDATTLARPLPRR